MQLKEKVDKVQLVNFYREMLRIRLFEEECGRQYMQGKIRGFLHLYIGEEAIAVGSISVLQPDDYIVTHYRDHGHALARGIESKAVMAELFGKATGCSKGKGGSMHLFDVKRNFLGGYAIVGGQLPIATGLALAISYKGENKVVLAYLGDGALNEGEFHECMNLASIWKLPVLFFCENNLYGMGASVTDTFAMHDQIYKVAEAYKMPSKQIDGMNVLTVRDATHEAVEYMRRGSGPFFLEAKTYRFRGHSIADPAEYRKTGEVEEWQKRDPIPSFRKYLLKQEIALEAEIKAIEAEIEKEIEEAVRFAEESPWPTPEALNQHVYTKPL
jgi:pyruvate dehydrogenase E1 component alpha subunit